MKPNYFAKWLPVEGEIKEHSIVLACVKIGTVVHMNNHGYEIEVQNPTGVLLYLKKEDVRLAKLFLCSRDIKPGDKVWYNNKEYEVIDIEETTGALLCAGRMMLKKEDCIKVIGEISPDALSYIKAGQEIEEYEPYIFGHGKEWHGYNTKRHWPVEYPNVYKVMCRVKGPCGHFH